MKCQADFTVWSDLLCETSIKAVNPCIFSGEEWQSIFVSLLKYAVAHGGHNQLQWTQHYLAQLSLLDFLLHHYFERGKVIL